MAPSSKRLKVSPKSLIVAYPTTSEAKSPRRRGKPVEQHVKTARKNAAINEKSEATTSKILFDEDRIFEILCDPKSLKKSSSKKRKKPQKPTRCSSPVDFAEILKEEEPKTPRDPNKSIVDEVFEKWMEIDPYACIDRYLPAAPLSPDRPLTLFSPEKERDRPQCRFRPRRPFESPADRFGNEWGASTLSSARKEIQLGATPLFRKCLDPSAYSPCKSSGQTMSRLNASSGEDESFSCSTPLTFKTPSAPVNRSSTTSSQPLSGVKALFNDKGPSNGETNSPMLAGTTPTCSSDTPVRPSYNSLTGCTNFSNTPGGFKSNALFGVTCYVEVRYNKEDRSEWVRNEVMFHGAKVEKNFTKKVTHVIFKEGKISTFMKAQELNIPVVSVLWIEACASVGGLVDPKQFAPTDNEEYLKNVPIEEDRRRERFLRRGRAFLDMLDRGEFPKPRSNKKKVAATEGKKKQKVVTKPTIKSPTKRQRPKKLDFNDPGPSQCADKKSTDNESEYISETEIEETASEERKRRKSAPADLGKGNQQKVTQFFKKTTKVTKEKGEDPLKTPPKSSDQSPSKDLMNILTGGYVTTGKKRRKLFNPNDSISFSQPVPGTPVEMSPYIKESPARATRSRSTSSKKSKKIHEAKRPLTARKSLAPLMENEEHDGLHNTNSSRSSLACFELDKKSKVSVKCQPRIAFTSISKEEIARCKIVIKKLGMFDVDATVTKRTTHLLTSPPARRTVNMVKAIARGCWILDVEWLNYSETNGKWMSEEPYELKSFSEAVTVCRLERQAFGKDFSLDLFSNVGHIFVGSDVQPPRPDLVELLKLCGGRVVNVSVRADVVISNRPTSEESSDVTVVNPVWILDSITQNKSLPLDSYKI